MKLDNAKKLGLIILILGLLTRFLFIWHPAEVVFDEVHYGKAVNECLKGEYFFTGHPPLAPQLITLGAWLGKYRPHFAFENIGEKFNDNSFISLRVMPNLAGALIPLAAYILLIVLGVSSVLSFFAGMFLVFENALLVQSHFILIDAFLILFGLLGLIFFFASQKRNYKSSYLGLAGLFFGMTAAVKWTGLGFFLFAGLIVAMDLIMAFRKKSKDILKIFIKLAVCFLIIPLLVYFLVFCVHFKLLPKSGPGDAFMSKEFLNGEKNYIEKFIELNKTNNASNITGLTATHPYSSKLYSWPFMERSIYYWVNGDAKIYLIGNPIVWWSSTAAVFLLIIYLILFAKHPLRNRAGIILLLGYFCNLLPFFIIKRVTFLYHYLTALIFAVSILAYLIGKNKNSKKILIGLLALSIAAFFYFAPLSYGFKMSPKQSENRFWFNSWK